MAQHDILIDTLRNNFRRGGAKDTYGRGSGRIYRPPREELKVSANVESPSCFLLQYKTDGVPPQALSGARGVVLLLKENAL